eukprot:m.108242 g.108242  ORF g.108242 m.108242 type:complete len:270 (-) comp27858_c0_seq1:348-1157(-)
MYFPHAHAILFAAIVTVAIGDIDLRNSCSRCGIMIGCGRNSFGDGMCSDREITDFKLNATFQQFVIDNDETIFAAPKLPCCETSDLDLSSNGIKKIVNGMLNLSQLRRLHLNDNYITFVQTGAFDQVALLESIDLSMNDIVKLGVKSFTGIPNLLSLYLDSNPILCRTDNSSGSMVQSCYGCHDHASRPTLFVGDLEHEYQQCFPITHVQVLIAVLFFELVMFYIFHITCMKPTIAINDLKIDTSSALSYNIAPEKYIECDGDVKMIIV